MRGKEEEREKCEVGAQGSSRDPRHRKGVMLPGPLLGENRGHTILVYQVSGNRNMAR